jgi:tRNA(fMet)-specific endonuclease VapC
MILLDTDHFSIQKHSTSPRWRNLLARLQVSTDKEIGTTIITVEEEIRGWMATIARERLVTRQIIGYRELRDFLALVGGWTIIPFDDRSAEEFDRLRRSGVRRLGSRDLKIASIALTRNALLLSANLRDFQQVPGLRVENWLD